MKLKRALRDWLLEKLEDQSLWFTAQGTPQPLSVAELTGHVEKDLEFITALDLWTGQKDTPVTAALETLLADQVVPYLAASRYTESGLRKRAEWEQVWSLQRDADAGLINASDIPVPPKYTGADFVKQSVLVASRQTRCAQRTLHRLPRRRAAHRPQPVAGMGGLESRPAGHRPSGSFRPLLIVGLVSPGGAVFSGRLVYYPTRGVGRGWSAGGCVLVDCEQVGESLLGGAHVGEHALHAGTSLAAVMVEQHGLLDASELVE